MMTRLTVEINVLVIGNMNNNLSPFILEFEMGIKIETKPFIHISPLSDILVPAGRSGA